MNNEALYDAIDMELQELKQSAVREHKAHERFQDALRKQGDAPTVPGGADVPEGGIIPDDATVQGQVIARHNERYLTRATHGAEMERERAHTHTREVQARIFGLIDGAMLARSDSDA